MIGSCCWSFTTFLRGFCWLTVFEVFEDVVVMVVVIATKRRDSITMALCVAWQ